MLDAWERVFPRVLRGIHLVVAAVAYHTVEVSK